MFCTVCGGLLSPPDTNGVVGCFVCTNTVELDLADTLVVRTLDRLGAAGVAEEAAKNRPLRTNEKESQATIDEECPNCGHGIAFFTTAQLRSADEGQTVFYVCCECRFKWSVNN